MPAIRTATKQADWSDGMVRDIAPALISPAGAYDIVDALLDEDGSPYRRGGTEYKSRLGFPAVLDNFNRADENPVSQGGNWTGKLGDRPVSEETNLQVTSNKLKAVGANGSAAYNKTITDGVVYLTVSEAGENPSFRLYIRTAGAGNAETLRGYFLQVYKAAETWYWLLMRRDEKEQAGAVALYSHQAVSDGDSIALMAVGSEISAWYKSGAGAWQMVLTGADATYPSGKLGVTAESSTARLDDFGGGDLTPFSKTGLTWIWDGYLKPGARTVCASAADFGTLASDDQTVINLGGSGLSLPKQSAVLEELLFIGGAAIYGGSRKEAVYSAKTVKVTKGSTTVTGKETAFLANVDAGMLFHIGSERVYVVASVDGETSLTLRDAYEGESGEGKSYTLNPIWSIGGSDPYEAWDYATTCANRLVVASGRVVKFTEIKNPHTFTNALATTNEHTLPEGVECVGLATVGQTVLIFTTGGIWMLDGLPFDIVDANGNPQHRLQQLSTDIVLAGASGLAGSGQQIVVPAADGIYLMDGISQPVRVSRPVDNVYRRRIADGYRLGRAVVYRGHYLLPILSSAGAVRDLFVARLDRATRSRRQNAVPWSRFTGDGGEIASFAVRSRTGPSEPKLLGAQARKSSQIVNCSPYFEPTASVKNDADGSTHNFDLTTRDMETGSDTANEIRNLMLRYELADAAEDEPEVKVYWSTGSLTGDEAEWDEVNWDEFNWAVEEQSAEFNAVDKSGPVNDGHKRVRFRINKKLPYGRFRIKTVKPAASFALRSLEMNIRPSGASRR